MAALPPYVQYGGLVGMPPVVGTGATVFGFFLKVDKPTVTALCHKVFEAPTMNAVTGQSAVTCTPLSDPASNTCYVMMIVDSIAAVKSALGGVPISENEVLLQVPIKVTKPPQPAFNALFAPIRMGRYPGLANRRTRDLRLQ